MNGREIERKVRKATAEALNLLADKVGADAIPETPLLVGTLRASEVTPGTDLNNANGHQATEEHLEAMVSFNTMYAAAQHEGHMEYIRDGNHVTWVVRRHSEPGTKTKYLEDPLKAQMPKMESFIAAYVRKALSL